MKNHKEFLYVGHYVDVNGNYMLKVGTTNDLARRKAEHTRNYRKAKQYTLPKESVFEYDWYIPLSKYNTLRYEDLTRERWIVEAVGEYVRNDRFKCENPPKSVSVTIRKTYEILL